MGLLRKVIRICAEDSPNVGLGLQQRAAGETPTGKVIVPGVLPWFDYVKRRNTWDEMAQCIGLDGRFYEGKEVKLYPPLWLANSALLADQYLKSNKSRRGKAIGIDPAEGGDSTCWTVIDELGILIQISEKTPDTSVIAGRTIQLMTSWGVPADKVCFDRGGGGKQHADYLRSKGYAVKTVAFGQSVKPPPQRGMKSLSKREAEDEEGYIYKNRRGEMYGMLSQAIDPGYSETPFAIPREYDELHRQLSGIPKQFDSEGRLVLPPKNKNHPDQKGLQKTLIEILGCSPDEADSTVIAYWILHRMDTKPTIGPPRKKPDPSRNRNQGTTPSVVQPSSESSPVPVPRKLHPLDM